MKPRNRRKAFVIFLVLVLAMSFAIAGCTSPESSNRPTTDSMSAPEETGDIAQQADNLRIVSMKGATSVGLAQMMKENQGRFTVVESADRVGPMLLQDDADIALVPANMAAMLYQKTNGDVCVIDVNTLGVLYVVTGDESIDSIDALVGKTIYMTGKGTVPEYTLMALLSERGLSMADVGVQFKSEPSEVAALLVSDKNAVGILPQPYATSVTIKDPEIKMTIDLSLEWEKVASSDAGEFVTGVTIAKASYVKDNPEVVLEFLKRHAASAVVAEDDPSSIAQIVVDAGIIENAALAEQAIPRCNVVCLTGEEMKTALSGYLAKLFEQEPASVGGVLPDESFYYLG